MTEAELQADVARLVRDTTIDSSIHASLESDLSRQDKWLKFLTGASVLGAVGSFFDQVKLTPAKPFLVVAVALLTAYGLVARPGDAARTHQFLKTAFLSLAGSLQDLLDTLPNPPKATAAEDCFVRWYGALRSARRALEGYQGKRPAKLAAEIVATFDKTRPDITRKAFPNG